MSLFTHYELNNKQFPCNDQGFLEPNFKREWVQALARHRFKLDNAQNIRTWHREWPTLDDSSKKSAISNLLTQMGKLKNEDGQPAFPWETLLAPYFAPCTAQDALLWVQAFMASSLAERKASSSMPTLGLAAHLLNWIRQSHPSALGKTVAMLTSWVPLHQTAIYYKDTSAWPQALEGLSLAMPNTELERTSALACAISGNNALLCGLLERPSTDTASLWRHAQKMVETPQALFKMLGGVQVQASNPAFMANVRSLGQRMLDDYRVQSQAPDFKLDAIQLRQQTEFFKTLVSFGVDCARDTCAFVATNKSKLSIAPFFQCLQAFAPSWGPQEHKALLDLWTSHGGLFVSEDMFGNLDNTRAVLNALMCLPEEWTHWFEDECQFQLLRIGPAIFVESHSSDESNVPMHRWLHEHMPKLYTSIIRGIPARLELLQDPIIGPAAWQHTQAGQPEFIFDSTFDWFRHPQTIYDIHNAMYPMARAVWAHHGVDLDAALAVAMQDKDADYRALVLEAVSPGHGKERWQAVVGLLDAFRDPNAGLWSEDPMVKDAVMTCIQERLHPNLTQMLHIDNTEALFS